MRSSVAPLALLVLTACIPDLPKSVEGASPGDCADGADNDEDGAFDCNDSDCSGSPDCVADTGDTGGYSADTGADTGIDSAETGGDTANANTAPSAPGVAVTPAAPRDSDALSCVLTVESVDPDGDAVTYAHRWTVDGVDAGVTSDTVGADRTRPGETWTCHVTASDGELTSDEGVASVVISDAACLSGYFDGLNDYAEVAVSSLLAPTAVTVSAWVRLDDAGWGVLWSKHSGENAGWWMYGTMVSSLAYIAKAQNEFFVSDPRSFAELQGSWAVSVGEWHHLAQRYDDATGEHTLFLDGVRMARQVYGTGLYAPSNSFPMFLGADGPGTPADSYFNGWMDDVLVYGRALSDAEIATLASDAGEPMDARLAVWRLNGTSDDDSGKGHLLTMRGAAFVEVCR